MSGVNLLKPPTLTISTNSITPPYTDTEFYESSASATLVVTLTVYPDIAHPRPPMQTHLTIRLPLRVRFTLRFRIILTLELNAHVHTHMVNVVVGLVQVQQGMSSSSWLPPGGHT